MRSFSLKGYFAIATEWILIFCHFRSPWIYNINHFSLHEIHTSSFSLRLVLRYLDSRKKEANVSKLSLHLSLQWIASNAMNAKVQMMVDHTHKKCAKESQPLSLA